MDFKYYRLSWRYIVMLTLLTVATGFALWWGSKTLALLLLVLLAAACAGLMRLYRNLLESMDLMLKAFIYKDYTFRLPETSRMNNSRQYINRQFNTYSRHLQRQQQAQHEQDMFHQTVMEHLRTGIVVISESGHVEQANPMALQLLEMPVLHDVTDLHVYGRDVVDAFRLTPPGTPRQLVLHTPRQQKTLWLRVTRLSTAQDTWRIVTVDDNRQALDQRETNAYNQLLHVLSHEIMNGITPIASLSATLTEKPDAGQKDCMRALRLIHTTSSGLLDFVENCRRFMSLPQPLPILFYVRELTDELDFMQLVPPHINWECRVEPADLMLHADKQLIRQVLVNLLRNAVQAIGNHKGRICCRACTTEDDHVTIQMSNDGPPITETERTHVFVPFFTTKQKGTGLGLSVCRQIMSASNGTISLLPTGAQGWNTTFVLDFA